MTGSPIACLTRNNFDKAFLQVQLNLGITIKVFFLGFMQIPTT